MIFRRFGSRRAALVVVLVAAATPAAEAAGLHPDLHAVPLDPAAYRVIGKARGGLIEPGPGGLRLKIPPGGPKHDSVGIEVLPWVRGDFEMTADYEIVEAGPPKDGWGAGIGLMIELDSSRGESLTVERLVLPKEGSRFNSTHITGTTLGERRYHPAIRPASQPRGRLRLVRKGEMVEALAADGDGPFRKIRDIRLGAKDIKLVRLSCYTGQSECVVDVVVKDFQLHAAELLTAEQARRTQPGGHFGQIWIVLLLNLGLVAALVAWNWPRIAARYLQQATRHGRALLLVVGGALVVSASYENHREAIEVNDVHEDENACIVKSYFYRLAAIDGDFEHPLWEDADGLDTPHVSDMLIGASLQLSGEPVPLVPEVSFTWAVDHHPAGARLWAARLPSTILGALVPFMLYLIGIWATGRLLVGLIAGLAYAYHPLALLSQARAMTEGPLMFFSVAALLVLVHAFRRGEAKGSGTLPPILLIAGPAALGLAINSKLTGLYIAVAVGASLALAAAWEVDLRRRDFGRLRGRLSHLAAFVTLTVIATITANPTLYRSPWSRFREMIALRWRVQGEQRETYRQWALYTLTEKGASTYSQVVGYPLGSLAMPTVALAGVGWGVLSAREWRRWRSGGRPSASLPIVVWTLAIMGGMIPSLALNWDRYFLPVVPCWALLVGVGVSALLSGAGRLVRNGSPRSSRGGADPSPLEQAFLHAGRGLPAGALH